MSKKDCCRYCGSKRNEKTSDQIMEILKGDPEPFFPFNFPSQYECGTIIEGAWSINTNKCLISTCEKQKKIIEEQKAQLVKKQSRIDLLETANYLYPHEIKMAEILLMTKMEYAELKMKSIKSIKDAESKNNSIVPFYF